MKPGFKIFIAIVVVIVLFIMTAPASLVTSVLPEENSPLSLSGFQGKALSGEAAQVTFKGIPIQNVQWDLNFLSTITGSPSASLIINDPDLTMNADATFKSENNWSMNELSGDIQLRKLEQFIPGLRPLALSGSASLRDISVALAKTAYETGEGSIQWDNASLRINNQALDLDSITAELGLDGTDLVLDYLGTSALAPKGRIKLSPAGAYELTLNITPAALPQNLQWLSRMGKPSPDGTVDIDFKGRLR